jgi:hypothetical protein
MDSYPCAFQGPAERTALVLHSSGTFLACNGICKLHFRMTAFHFRKKGHKNVNVMSLFKCIVNNLKYLLIFNAIYLVC